jgi:hypothetical protein
MMLPIGKSCGPEPLDDRHLIKLDFAGKIKVERFIHDLKNSPKVLPFDKFF